MAKKPGPARIPLKTPASTGPLAADLNPLRHIDKAIPVSVNVKFLADDDATLAAISKSTPKSDDSAEALLPDADRERLRALDAKVMAWLNASDSNRQTFAADPVAALAKIDKSLDNTFLKKIQRVRLQAANDAIDPRIKIDSARLSAGKPATKSSTKK